jgi:hypothetical protein
MTGYRITRDFVCASLSPAPVTVPCSIVENAAAGSSLTCPSLRVAFPEAEYALDAGSSSSSLTLNGFSLVNSVVHDFESAPVINATLSVCAPRNADAFNTSSLYYSTCLAYSHTLLSVTIELSVLDINEPPVFDVARLNLSSPGVGTVNQAIGFPLSRIASDPDTAPPFNTLTYSLNSGVCHSTSTGALPVDVQSADGQLFYNVSGPLTAWSSPLALCVIITDGGALSASLDVSVYFTDVSMQLSVFPAVLNVTHYTFGVSVHNISVTLYTGTFVHDTWTVRTPPVQWVSVFRSSISTLTVVVNSSLLLHQQLLSDGRVVMIVLETTGAHLLS